MYKIFLTLTQPTTQPNPMYYQVQDLLDALPLNHEPEVDTSLSALEAVRQNHGHCIEAAMLGECEHVFTLIVEDVFISPFSLSLSLSLSPHTR